MYIARLSGYANFHAFPFIEPGLPPPMAHRYRVFIFLGLLSLSNRTCSDYVLPFGLASFSTIRFVVPYGRRPHHFPLFILYGLETCHDIIRHASLDFYDTTSSNQKKKITAPSDTAIFSVFPFRHP